jgi:hypothetical protein
VIEVNANRAVEDAACRAARRKSAALSQLEIGRALTDVHRATSTQTIAAIQQPIQMRSFTRSSTQGIAHELE